MNHLLVFLVVLLLASSGGLALWAKNRAVGRSEWNTLVARLAPLDSLRLAQIAHAEESDFGPGGDYTKAEEQSKVWFMETGLKGLDDLQNNCLVMIDMAHYVQSRYPDAVVVAEQLRLTARQVEWHLDRIRLASRTGHLEACFAEYGNRAIGLYCGMTETIKVLYQGLDIPEQAQLHAVL